MRKCNISGGFFCYRGRMSFQVGSTIYKDASDCLDDVERMVRIGIARDGGTKNLKVRVTAAISALKQAAALDPVAMNEGSLIRLEIEESEFLFQTGKSQDAARVLTARWNDLAALLKDGPERRSANRSKIDNPLLDLKLLALMQYVFYQFFAHEARHQAAIDLFLKIEKIIQRRLVSKNYRPSAILAHLHYFIAHCYRAQRKFPLAEEHFSQAQREEQQRLQARLALGPPIDREYEIIYGNVFTARVQGIGLGWAALHEGRLRRAAHLLSTAQSLLVASGHDALKCFMEFNLQTVFRRRAPFDSREYEDSLRGLESCWKEWRRLSHPAGRRRCLFELIRGHLDRAEFDELDRKAHLSEARRWFQELGQLSDKRDLLRNHLLRCRLLLISGDLSGAQAELTLGRAAASKDRDTEILNESAFELENMAAVLSLAKGEPKAARLKITTTLGALGPGPTLSSGQRHIDSVLEAECYLLLAQASRQTEDYKGGRAYFERWTRMSHSVQNYYLHAKARSIRDSIVQDPFHIEYKFDVERKNVRMYCKEFRAFLDRSIAERFHDASVTKLALIYGVDRSVMSRRLAEQGASWPGKRATGRGRTAEANRT